MIPCVCTIICIAVLDIFLFCRVYAESEDAMRSPWHFVDSQVQQKTVPSVLLDGHGIKSCVGKTERYLLLKASMIQPEEDEFASLSNPPIPMNSSGLFEGSSFARFPAFFAVRLYQKVISPTKGRNCPMYPSCSSYCTQAIQQKGFFQGFLMTVDRLNRCGHDLQLYPITKIHDHLRFDDPPLLTTVDYYRERLIRE